MRPRSIPFRAVLIAALFSILTFYTSLSYADTFERDQITRTIEQKKARWSPRDTHLSRLNKQQRVKRFGSDIPAPTGSERIVIAPAVSVPLRLNWRAITAITT